MYINSIHYPNYLILNKLKPGRGVEPLYSAFFYLGFRYLQADA